jgi:nucleotide-binding universal stress UspA family protein
MQEQKHILALVDHSVYAESVADHAGWLSRASGAAIDIVHVVDPIDPAAIHAGMAGLAVGGPGIVRQAYHSEEKLAALESAARLHVDALAARVAAQQDAVATGHVMVGELRRTVAGLQREAALIVVGKRGDDADFVGLTLGSNLRNVIGVAQIPLLIVPRVFRDIAGWVLGVGDDAGIARPLASLLEEELLPPMPCEIVHVGKADIGIKGDLEIIDRELVAHGHASTISLLRGPIVRLLAERLATEPARLLAIEKFGRARILPQLFGDSVASDITKASLGPVLVMAP